MAQIKNKKKYPLITPKDKDFLVVTQESTGKTRSISVGDLSQHIVDKIPNTGGDAPIKDIKFKGESLPVVDKSVEIPSKLSEFDNDLDIEVGDKNKIEKINFKNKELQIIDKSVEIPSKLSEFDNDLDIKTQESVENIKSIADLRIREGKEEGEVIRLLGYYEAGDKPELLYKWVLGEAEDDGGSVIKVGKGYWDALFGYEVYISDYGVKEGEDISNIIKVITKHSKINFENISYTMSENVILKFDKDCDISNLKVEYTGDVREFLIKINCNNNIRIQNLNFNLKNKISKGLYIDSNSTGKNVEVLNSVLTSGLAQNNTGTSCGIYITNKLYFEYVNVRFNTVNNFSSILSQGVTRGIWVNNYKRLFICDNNINNITPSKDGDGIYITSEERPNITKITNNIITNCAKRSVKTQVEGVIVETNVFIRDKKFEESLGQAEVDLQKGGKIQDNVFLYNNNSSPANIISVWVDSNNRGIVQNNTVKSSGENDLIKSFVQVINNSGEKNGQLYLNNNSIKGKVENLIQAYSNYGLENTEGDLFNIYVKNTNNLQFNGDKKSIVLLKRGAETYVTSSITIQDSKISEDKELPTYILDSSSGSIGYFKVNRISTSNSYGFIDSGNISSSDVSSRVGLEEYSVNENKDININAEIKDNTSQEITVMYISNRSSIVDRLYGKWFLSSYGGKIIIKDLTSDIGKTSTNSGSINIGIDDNNVVIKKHKGEGSISGKLTIYKLYTK